MAHSVQPAKKGYFFEQGYTDIRAVVKQTFSLIKKRIDDQRDAMSGSEAAGFIFHIAVIVSIAVFGGIFSLTVSAAHVIVNFLIMLGYYAVFLVVLAIDRAYLSLHKIAISCYECKAKFMYPIYVCPSCGAKHDRLTASVYGAFHRTCECGYKLPTSIFNFKEKRKDLKAFCPECDKNRRTTPLSDRASRPICIPVVGGPSVGKSAFITAYTNLFADEISVEKGIDIELYNDARVFNDYKAMKNFYRTGQIVKTAVQTDVTKASSIAFSFFPKHPSLRPERLVHIYDIAGESFVGRANEVQKQYDYCHGIILLLDPFSIPDVMARFGAKLNSVDLGGTSTESIDSMMENFVLLLEETTGLSRGKILKMPLAVVLNKADEADLDLVIGDTAIRRAMASHPDVFTDFLDTMDYLCREFLMKVDMADVMAHIQQNFKNTRFFVSSAIGHTLNMGRYYPRHVIEVFDWIYSHSDRKFASVVTSTVFSKAKLPLASGIGTIDLEAYANEEKEPAYV